MKTISFSTTDLPSDVFSTNYIKKGENLSSELNITLTEDFLDYKYMLLFQLNDTTPIATEEIVPVDDVLEYTITNALTTASGQLKIEIQCYTDDAVLMKTAIFVIPVKESLDGTDPDVMPESYVPWYLSAVAILDDAEQAVLDANTAAENANVAALLASETNQTVANAEALRVTAEQGRADAELLREQGETDRDNAYTVAESGRNSAYQTAEDARNTAYGNAEDARDAAEATAKAARDNTEAEAKTARDNTEAQAKTIRDNNAVSAEQARQTTFDTNEAGRSAYVAALPHNGAVMTNLAPNGDFSNGTTGWTAGFSANSVAGNTLINTCDGTATSGKVINSTFSLVIGNKYYYKARVRVTNSKCTRISLQCGNAQITVTKSNPVMNEWYPLSCVGSTSAITTFVNIIHNYASAADANGAVMEIQYVLVADLTSAFGAGNEPTAEQMDRLLSYFPDSWFNGNANITDILQCLIAEKASKTQEAWIAPTLLNGWTVSGAYTVGYRKSTLGMVEMKGRVTGGSIQTTILTLPTGYRPSTDLSFPVVSGVGSYGYCNVYAATGNVNLWAGNTGYVCFDSIKFTV